MRSLANCPLVNADARVVYRQESDQLAGAAAALGLTGGARSLLPGLAIGQNLRPIKHHAFLVKRQTTLDEMSLSIPEADCDKLSSVVGFPD